MRKGRIHLLATMLVLAAATSFAGTSVPTSQIAAGIQARIYSAGVFKHGNVQVAFDKGVATLSGTVDNLGSKHDAERAARKVAGVTEVVDNIQVRADDVSEQQILNEARKQIVTYPYYGIFDNIVLGAENDRLVVSGQVTQPSKKSDIGRLLARVKGVAAVENNLEVLPNSLFDDRLRVGIARAIYGDPYFIYYADQAIPPIHIIVKNGNVTLEGVVSSPLDRAKAEMAARTTGTSFAVVNNLRLERS
jgi:hyperosmotically inducible protein